MRVVGDHRVARLGDRSGGEEPVAALPTVRRLQGALQQRNLRHRVAVALQQAFRRTVEVWRKLLGVLRVLVVGGRGGWLIRWYRDRPIEGGRPVEVPEEQRGADEGLRAELRVGGAERAHAVEVEKSEGAVDILQIERKLEGQALGHGETVQLGPGRDSRAGQLQRPVLRRQRHCFVAEKRVDALGVGREPGVDLRRLHGRAGFGRPSQAQRAQLDVLGQHIRHAVPVLVGSRAEHLGQGSREGSALEIHLEQPVPRVQVALQEDRVVLGLCEYGRHAVPIEDDRRGCVEPLE